jgi:hypothetical protein
VFGCLDSLTEEFKTHAGTIYEQSQGTGIDKFKSTPDESWRAAAWLRKPIEGVTINRYTRALVQDRLRKINASSVKVLAELIPCPDGWEKTVHEGTFMGDFLESWTSSQWHDYSGNVAVVIEGPAVRLIFNLIPVNSLNPWNREDGDGVIEVGVDGHTNFQARKAGKLTWFTKSRRGHENSFCGNDLTDWDAVIEEQLEWVTKTRIRVEGLVPVPGTRWSIDPARKAEIVAQIQESGYSFVPAAMGTGNRFSTRASSYSRRANASTEDFFGVAPLFIENLDCD